MKKNLLLGATSLVCALAMSTTLATNAQCNKSGCNESSKADNKAYLEEISTKISKNYSVPSGFDVVKAKIGFDMDANGNVNHLRLLDDEDAPAEGQSSVTRTALIKAIKNSAPFPSPGSVKKPVKMVASFNRTNPEQTVVCTVQMK
jgi:hypothetical protein